MPLLSLGLFLQVFSFFAPHAVPIPATVDRVPGRVMKPAVRPAATPIAEVEAVGVDHDRGTCGQRHRPSPGLHTYLARLLALTNIYLSVGYRRCEEEARGSAQRNISLLTVAAARGGWCMCSTCETTRVSRGWGESTWLRGVKQEVHSFTRWAQSRRVLLRGCGASYAAGSQRRGYFTEHTVKLVVGTSLRC